ncbi:MAG: NUDIX hydrolase [Nocardioidaceae bacterium]
MQTQRRIAAAGAVAWRKSKRASGRTLSGFGQLELLLVHRPKYDDWTFPKGKADAGEELPATAVREVREETGAQVRLGVPLLELSYETSQGTKDVTYWSARVTGGVDATDYAANVEVDEVRWVGAPSVTDLLTYERDREVLEAFVQAHAGGAHKTRTLVIVRHAEAEDREDWSGDDEHRPLSRAGRERAGALVAMFAAYGVEHLVSSDTARCVSTIEPYAEKAATYIALDSRLAQKPAKEPPGLRWHGRSTHCSSTSRRCWRARTGRCCRRCSRRSGCPMPSSRPASWRWCTTVGGGRRRRGPSRALRPPGGAMAGTAGPRRTSRRRRGQRQGWSRSTR